MSSPSVTGNNGGMTSENPSRPNAPLRGGAIDLSSLQPAAEAPAGGSYVVEITEADFDTLASKSMQYPVILEITMASAPETRAVDDALVRLANAAGGRWLLARVDVQASPRIAQALGVQAVPAVMALIAGQVAPLFQGTRDEADIRALLDEVIKVALQNGVTGRAQPGQGSPAQDEDGEPVADPRFAAADAALQRGDFAGAAAEFDKLIKSNPRDVEAIAGKAQSELLARSLGADVETVLAAATDAPDDVDAQLAAADVEIIAGDPAAGFDRLIGLIRRLPSDAREPVRARVVELFTTMDPADPAVLKARRELSAALF